MHAFVQSKPAIRQVIMPLSYHWNLCVYMFISSSVFSCTICFPQKKKDIQIEFCTCYVWKSIIIFWWYNQDYIWANKIHICTHNLSPAPASFCFSFFFSFCFLFCILFNLFYTVGCGQHYFDLCLHVQNEWGFIDYLLLPEWLCSARQFVFKYDSSLLSISLSNTLVTFPIS